MICTKCCESKEVTDFYTRGYGDLRRPKCKTCEIPSPERQSWKTMLQRVDNPNKNGAKYYYGRVKVCSRWRSFSNFLADMGPRPSKEWSLDRIDNDGDYEPGNVRWATRSVQNSNRRKRPLNIEVL